MEIQLKKTTSDPRSITKSFVAGDANTKTYQTSYAVNALDVMQPEIYLSDTGLEAFNYMYIPALNRYYFIRPTITANGYYKLNARCDVLMSHATEIRKQSGILARSNTIYTRYLTDPEYRMKVYRRVQTIPFSASPFTTSADAYYLTANGGYSGGGGGGE